MIGNGFMAVWCDVAAPVEAEWNQWYTQQHVPERVDVPGFLTGRRYLDASGVHQRNLAFYLTATPATLSSPDYLARLDDPTPWTQAMMPHFRNFARGVGTIVAEHGRGLGGAALAVRLKATGGAVSQERLADLAARLVGDAGLVAVRVGVTDQSATAVPTRERAFRGTDADASFDAIVLAEGHTRQELEGKSADLIAAIGAADRTLMVEHAAVYDLTFSLDP